MWASVTSCAFTRMSAPKSDDSGLSSTNTTLSNTRVLNEPPAHLARGAVDVKRSAVNGGTPSGGLYDRIRLGVDAYAEFVPFTLWNVQTLPLAPDV